MDPNNISERQTPAPVGGTQAIQYSKNPQPDANAEMLRAIQTLTQQMEAQKNELEKEKMREKIERLEEKNRQAEAERQRELMQMNMQIGLHNLAKNEEII